MILPTYISPPPLPYAVTNPVATPALSALQPCIRTIAPLLASCSAASPLVGVIPVAPNPPPTPGKLSMLQGPPFSPLPLEPPVHCTSN